MQQNSSTQINIFKTINSKLPQKCTVCGEEVKFVYNLTETAIMADIIRFVCDKCKTRYVFPAESHPITPNHQVVGKFIISKKEKKKYKCTIL